jgi:hypothetical protein
MTEPGDRIGDRMPAIDLTDPAQVEAFYGNFSFCDHWRKTVLANAKEVVRAKYELANAKITESRIEDLARTHDLYIEFLTEHLKGRTIREQNIRDMIGAV